PDLGGPRCSVSFLSEDISEDIAGPLSSTRRSLLEELDLGGGCGLGEPPSITSHAPWHHMDPGSSSGPPQPLASSTLLTAGDALWEGPPSPPTDLLVPRDRGHPQDTPGSSSTVLLVPGYHGHPQDTPTDAQSTPGLIPSIMRIPGDRDDHHDSSSDSQGSPRATSSPRPGLLEVPSPLGMCVSHLLAPRPPRSPVVEPGGPATLPSPSSHGTHRGESRRAAPLARPLPAVLPDCDVGAPGHSPELAAALRTGHIPDCARDELVLAQQFDHPDRNRHWREGLVKSSFNYLLLDPRTTQNLPLRSQHLSPAECFRTFVKAIFYVGKGTRARPNCHLAEALSQHSAGRQKGGPKVQRILEIWASGQGVISLHCFHNTVPAEAYTRESCLVEALGLQALTNQRKGKCYGAVASWPAERRRRLGVHMLHRVMRIFLAEGERQLRPLDIQGGR
ncbi:ANKL1 protein, partial [Piaya cayana]|nr:ANKL1 protein [Piaya cayana]